ncbi:MAG: hypothetical protein H7138_00655 [Myxococcales bacterium]|nr:hypothetical protein [Myxococcales bacterium]
MVGVAGLVSCEVPTTSTDRSGLLDPEICDGILPELVFWEGKSPAPLPPPQGPEGVVQIFDDPEDATRLWAFSTDAGKITSWLAFPATRLGSLVQQIHQPVAQLASVESFPAKTSVIKVRPPKPPRLAAYVLAGALRELAVTRDVELDIKLCDDDDDDDDEGSNE